MTNNLTSLICFSLVTMGGLMGMLNDGTTTAPRSLRPQHVAIESDQDDTESANSGATLAVVEKLEQLNQQVIEQREAQSGFEGQLKVTNIESTLKSLSEQLSEIRKITSREVREIRNKVDTLKSTDYKSDIAELKKRVEQLELHSTPVAHHPVSHNAVGTIVEDVVVSNSWQTTPISGGWSAGYASGGSTGNVPIVRFPHPRRSLQSSTVTETIDDVKTTSPPRAQPKRLFNRRFNAPQNCVDGTCRPIR